MSEPKPAVPVKLFAAILFAQKEMLSQVLDILTENYGLIDFLSPPRQFSYTDYYCPEMGADLQKIIVTFSILVRPESLPDIKLCTNSIEDAFSRDGRRMINIDPGYIAPAHLILATGKGYTHRPYLRDGIYADVTLIYHNKSYQELPWTYPDYCEEESKAMFQRIRAKYISQLNSQTQ